MSNRLQEKLLLYRIRTKRDTDAFAKLYDAYIQRIYRFVYFKVNRTEEAQDLTSETFLRLWQYLQEGKQVTYVGALLYQIARNVVVDHHRRSRPGESESSEEELAIMPDFQALAAVERTAELSQVLAAVRLLKEEYREALTMRYIDGLEPREIAQLLGKSPGNIRVVLHRALETVRALLTSSQGEGEK